MSPNGLLEYNPNSLAWQISPCLHPMPTATDNFSPSPSRSPPIVYMYQTDPSSSNSTYCANLHATACLLQSLPCFYLVTTTSPALVQAFCFPESHWPSTLRLGLLHPSPKGIPLSWHFTRMVKRSVYMPVCENRFQVPQNAGRLHVISSVPRT